jgi:hypothetical protein
VEKILKGIKENTEFHADLKSVKKFQKKFAEKVISKPM